MTAKSNETFLRSSVSIVLLAAVGILIYADSFQVPFVLDDNRCVFENRFIRLEHISVENFKEVLNSPSKNRPVTDLTFALNYYFHQYDVFGYHAVNVVIHILTAILVFCLAHQTLTLCRISADWLPLSAALIWSVSPLHIQSVTYIVQRMNSLATMIFLLSLVCYVQARRIQRRPDSGNVKRGVLLGISIVSGVMATAAKEIALVLPVVIIFYEWYFFQDLKTGWLIRKLPWIGGILLIIISVVFFYLGSATLEKILLIGYEQNYFTRAQRLLTESRVVVYYISLLVFPHPSRLILEYEFPLSESLLGPFSTVFAIVALVSLVIAALYTASRNRLVSFALFWFLITLVIESTIIGLALIFEHRTYLPSVFPLMILPWLLRQYVKPVLLYRLLLLTAVCLGIVWTIQRNTQWRDPVVFLEDCIKKSPYIARSYVNLGAILMETDKIEEAENYFQKAIILEPDNVLAYNNLGLICYRQQKHGEAIRYFRQALAIKPNFIKAANNLGTVLLEDGQHAAARRCFERIIKMRPYFAMGYNNIGACLSRQSQFQKAIPYFQHALSLDPELLQAHNNLGEALLAAGRVQEAIDHLITGLRLDPDNIPALYHLAEAHLAQNHLPAATEIFTRLSVLQPENSKIFYNLSCLLARQNKRAEALTRLKQAIQKGYRDWDRLRSDNDLESIRDTPYYRQLVAQMPAYDSP